MLVASHSSTIWFFLYHTFSFLFRTWNQKVMCHEFDGHVELEESFFLSPSFSLMLIWACGHWRLLMFNYIFCSWNFLGHYNAWLVILLNIIYSCLCIGCWIGKQYSYRVGYLSTGIKFPGNINHWVAGMLRCPSRIEY